VNYFKRDEEQDQVFISMKRLFPYINTRNA